MSSAWPTRHEQSVLRKIARGYLRIELRDGQPTPVFTYEDGTAILSANSAALDEAGFARLARWLECDRNDVEFEGGVAMIWRALKPGKLPAPLPAPTRASPSARPPLPPLVPLTHIEWADRQWNLILARDLETGRVGWYCEHCSLGCENCWAEALNRRVGTGLPYIRQHRDRVEIFVPPERLLWRLPKKPQKIFVCDASDMFGEWVPDALLDTIFDRLATEPLHHAFQFLTKRPQRMAKYFTKRYAHGETGSQPQPNFWLGTSVENRRVLDRIDDLRATPAAIRFLSIEPLLEDIGQLDLRDIHWVIAGCESGPGARPMELDWVRNIRDQCLDQSVALFFKQTMDDAGKIVSLPELDGRQWRQFPIA